MSTSLKYINKDFKDFVTVICVWDMNLSEAISNISVLCLTK